MNPSPTSGIDRTQTEDFSDLTATAIVQAMERAVAAQLQPLRTELAELRKAAATTQAIAGFCQALRVAFFRGKTEPLAIPNIDYLIFSALQHGIQFESYDPAHKRMVFLKDGIRFATDGYFYVLIEMFAHDQYAGLRQHVDRPYVVYDVGMNRGYASLWFANDPQCRSVYGFELVESTYRWALLNFSLNPRLASKIIPSCTGLAGENKTVELLYENTGDGVSTINADFFQSYWTAPRRAHAKKTKATLCRASEVFAALPAPANGELRVLKIDVEGAEYEIFADLAQANRLDFDIILAEAHLGVDKFLALTPGYQVIEIVQHTDLMANLTLVRKH